MHGMNERRDRRLARLEGQLLRVLVDDKARHPGDDVSVEQMAVLTAMLAKILCVYADRDGTPDQTLLDMHVDGMREGMRFFRQCRESWRAAHPASARTH